MMDIIWACLKNTNVFCTIPGTALTWLTFSSNSVTATFFFLSGLSLKYIIMAALRTASSNLLSVDNLRTSVSFSGVIPSREWQTGKEMFRTKNKSKTKTYTGICMGSYSYWTFLLDPAALQQSCCPFSSLFGCLNQPINSQEIVGLCIFLLSKN